MLREEAPAQRKPSLDRSMRSIEVAGSKLEDAEKALEHDLTDAAIVLSYTSMFHAARALLFRDGVVEKSHTCLIEYLRENYVKAGRMSEAFMNAFDFLRVERHETLYGLETRSGRRDAEYGLKRSKEFVSMVKDLLEL